MRATIREQLLADGALVALLKSKGAADPIIVSSSAADSEIVLPRPHLILRMGTKEPGIGAVNRRDLGVWAHDDPGDYDLIDGILNRVREVLTALEARRTDDGKWISCVQWTGDSDDAYDDGPGTIVRTSNFTITGSGG